MEAEEKIQAHVLSIWREGRGFFSGKGREGMLVLTNKNLCFIKKTEAPMKWWGAIRTRQVVRLLQFKDVMIVEDGYGEENLREDLGNKKNQKISFNNILSIESKEKVWGSVLFLDMIEGGKFAEALESIPLSLSENAGMDPIDTLASLRSKQLNGNKWTGIDVMKGKVIDMKSSNIIEPLAVKLQIISAAAEAACMILRIDDVIATTKSAGPPPGAEGGMPPGMGGMGGMPPGMGGMEGMM